MVFESWETKFGMVILHSNVKKIRAGLFYFMYVLCVS